MAVSYQFTKTQKCAGTDQPVRETSAVMVAETVSLGILSLPSTLKAVGIVPGVILMIGLGIIATYTGYVLGQFKLRYPHVHTFADAGMIIGGRIGHRYF